MADSSIPITGGSGYNVDTRTTTDGDHREVTVVGDGASDATATVGPAGDLLTSLTTPSGAAYGIFASLTPHGDLAVSSDPSTVFEDAFDGSVVNTVKWATSGTIVPVQTNGTMTVSAGTSNSASSVLASNPTFGAHGLGHTLSGFLITLEANQLTDPNVHRFWGLGQVTSHTTATPVTDGVGFEVGIDGHFQCVMYVGGTKYVVNSTNTPNIASNAMGLTGSGTAAPASAQLVNFGVPVTWPGGTKRYGLWFRPDVVVWVVDDIGVPVAAATYLSPNAAALPVRLASVTTPATSTVQSVTFSSGGVAVTDTTKGNVTLSDAAYPWRQAQVGKFGGLATKGSVITPVSGTINAGSTGTIGPVDVSEAGAVNFTVKNANAANAYAGAPVLVFEQSDDSVSWTPIQVTRSDTGFAVPSGTVILGPNTANGSLMFAAGIDGPNWVRVRCTTGPSTFGLTVVIQPTSQSINPSVALVNASDVQKLSQTLSTSSTANSVATGTLNGQSQLAIQVAGTWTGTLVFEGTVDGSVWVPLNGSQVGTTNTLATTTTSNGVWHAHVGGLTNARVRVSSTGTGSATVSISATTAPWSPDSLGTMRADGIQRVAIDQTTLFTETCESIDTTNVWITGGTVPTASSGQITANAGTAALAASYMRTQPTFGLNATAFSNWVGIVAIEAGVVTGNKAWWGIGIPASSPTVASPLTNGIVFEVLDTDGALYGAVYSGGVRSQSVALTRPNDGGLHRYAIYYKTSRCYFEIDNNIVGSIAMPNTQVSSLPVTIGSVNGASTLGSARTLAVSLLGMADTGRNATKLADATYAWRQAKVGTYGDQAVSITNPASAIAGIYAGVTAYGYLRAALEPTALFNEPFDAALDTNKWATSGTVAPTVSSGRLNLVPGAATSASSAAATIPTWYQQGLNFLAMGWIGTFENINSTPGTLGYLNSHRFMGLGSVPGTWTTAYTASASSGPLLDGIGFETDTDGKLYPVIYSNGVRTRPTLTFGGADLNTGNGTSGIGGLDVLFDGRGHQFLLVIRADVILWYVDSTDVPVASMRYSATNFVVPNIQTLPARFHTLNSGTAPSGTMAHGISAFGVGDTGKNSSQIGDANYPWRKASVGKNGGLAVRGTSIPAVSGAIAAGGTGTIGPVDVSEAGNVTIVVKNTVPTSAWAGAPVLVFEQSDDGVSWGILPVTRSETNRTLSTHVLGVGAANAATSFDAALEGVNWVRVRVTTGPATNGITVVIQPGGLAFSPAVSVIDPLRTPFVFYTAAPIALTATDALLNLTGTRNGATVAATTTPAVVAPGKTLRITNFNVTYMATATSAYGVAQLRANTAGTVAIGSPVYRILAAGASTPATANSSNSASVASMADGLEFGAGAGIGISVRGYNGTAGVAGGIVVVEVSGYEY